MDKEKTLLALIAILLPSMAVFLHRGMGGPLLVNILLCLLFYLPGIIHALWVVQRS